MRGKVIPRRQRQEIDVDRKPPMWQRITGLVRDKGT